MNPRLHRPSLASARLATALLPPLALSAYAATRPWAIPWLWAATAGVGVLLGIALDRWTPDASASGPKPPRSDRSTAAQARRLGASIWIHRAVGLGLAGLVALVYLRTLSPTTDIGDSLELQVVASQLTFAHSPGYSLYTLLGHLYTRLPWKDIASRVNLFSAHASTLAILVLFLFTARLTRSRPAGLVAALLVAFSPAFWRQAVTTEVYALNSLLVVTTLYGLLRWWEQPERTPWLLATFAALGFGVVHHPTTWSLVPVVLAAVLFRAPRGRYRPRHVLAVGGAFGLGLSPLLYFVLRSPAVLGHRMSASELFTFVTASGYRPLFHADWALADPTRLLLYADELWRQFGGLPLALAAVGLLWLARHRLPWLVGLGAFYAAIVAFRVGYYVWDGWVVQTPAHLMVAVAAGAGLAAVDRALGWLAAGRWARTVGWTLVGLWLAARLWAVGPSADMSGGWPGYARAQLALAQPMPAGSWLVTDPDLGSGLLYDHILGNVRPDLTMVYADTGSAGPVLEDPAAVGRPVFLLDVPPPTNPALHPRSLGPLVELGTAPLTSMPDGFTPLPPAAASAGPGGASSSERPPAMAEGAAVGPPPPPVALAGIRLDPIEPAPDPGAGTASRPAEPTLIQGRRALFPGQSLGVTLLWRATGAITEDLETEIALWCGWGGEVGLARGRPVRGSYPTTAWSAGELIPDWHAVPVGLAAWSELCGLAIRLVDEGGQLRAVWSGPSVVVKSPARLADLGAMRPPYPVDVRWDGAIRLVGYDAPAAVRPGDEARIILAWEVPAGTKGRDLAVTIDAGSAGRLTEAFVTDVIPGSRLDESAGIVVTQHAFKIPADFPHGDLAVTLTMLRGRETLAYRAAPWPLARSGPYHLAPIEVRGIAVSRPSAKDGPRLAIASQPPALLAPARFADGIRLVDYGGPLVVEPGKRLYVPLEWEAYARPSRRYSAFVHVLDAAEAQRAGVDREILHASQPTSGWQQGQLGRDLMPLDLPRDLAPGGYRVQVGLYDQATKAPLPLVDPAGRAIDAGRVLFPLLVAPRTPPPLAYPAAARFGDEVALEALGLAPAGGIRAGSEITVTLRLRVDNPTAHDYSVFAHLRQAGRIIAQADGQPFGGALPLSAWPLGLAVDVPFILRVPMDLGAGRYEIAVGLYDLASGQRLSVAEGGGGAGGTSSSTAAGGGGAVGKGSGAIDFRGDQVVLAVGAR